VALLRLPLQRLTAAHWHSPIVHHRLVDSWAGHLVGVALPATLAVAQTWLAGITCGGDECTHSVRQWCCVNLGRVQLRSMRMRCLAHRPYTFHAVVQQLPGYSFPLRATLPAHCIMIWPSPRYLPHLQIGSVRSSSSWRGRRPVTSPCARSQTCHQCYSCKSRLPAAQGLAVAKHTERAPKMGAGEV
jgi:hypothetical protein